MRTGKNAAKILLFSQHDPIKRLRHNDLLVPHHPWRYEALELFRKVVRLGVKLVWIEKNPFELYKLKMQR